MSADQPELFTLLDVPVAPSVPLSADARRTARQRAKIEQGWHPLTNGRARPDLGTCGDCVHRRRSREGTFPKCEMGPITRGPATDVRAWWPACDRHQPITPTTEPPEPPMTA